MFPKDFLRRPLSPSIYYSGTKSQSLLEGVKFSLTQTCSLLSSINVIGLFAKMNLSSFDEDDEDEDDEDDEELTSLENG